MQKKTLTLRLAFSQSDVRILHTLYGIELSLHRGEIPTQPGAPGFPVRIEEVAIPEGMEVSRITAHVIQTKQLTYSPILVAPVREKGISPVNLEMAGKRQSRWVPPDPLLYEEAIKDMARHTAWHTGSRVEGRIVIAGVAVRPIRYDEFGCLELVTELKITVSLRPIKVKHPRMLRAEGRPEWSVRRYNFVTRNVINPDVVEKFPEYIETTIPTNINERLPAGNATIPMNGSIPVQVPRFVDYLIITDDSSWDAASITPAGSIGDLPGAFQRLADWKKDRGLRTHIARISDIVSGSYGDFSTGARDLQEVLRNFLKDFVWRHDTDYLLIGGGINIVPDRRVCGSIAYGHFNFADPNKGLTDDTVVWKNTFLGMRVHGTDLGIQHSWWIGDPVNDRLTMAETGEVIPYDSAGTTGVTSLRWYHTTDDTFSTFSAAPTVFIRVDGDPNVINGEVQWYTYLNLIPSDLYYASLYSPTYNVRGKHDWDLTGNGLYGQWSGSKNLDGVDYWYDVIVGRAPVEKVAEVNVFIDKIIAYEKAAERPADGHRFNRMLLVGEHFGDIHRYGHIVHASGDPSPPPDRQYSYDAANSRVLLNAPIATCGIPFSILSHVSGDDYRRIPYNPYGHRGKRGWYFSASADKLSPNEDTLSIFLLADFPILIASVTQWIVVFSDDPVELAPENFLLDEQGLDGSIQEQENLRDMIAGNVPSINEVHRLYSHETDLSTTAITATTLRELNTNTLLAELNDGPHLVSMSGHGWTGGCCQFNKDDVLDHLTNGDRTFIIFADSCNTNEFNKSDAISRNSLITPNGGAVAYVGNSRMSWQINGPAFLLGFFEEFSHHRWGNHLGFICGFSRGKLVNHHINDPIYRWTGLAQNLMGDPEMPVVRDEEDLRIKYVANKRTKEVHERNCPWVGKMWFKNMLYMEEKEWALSHGYDGCAFCLREYHTH